ncbi:MAG: DNA polymerase III subunit beta, partial [Candidatus Binatia bacterium]
GNGMEFEIEKRDFLDGLAPTQGVVEKRNTLPILSNVLIEPVEGGVSIMATDLDVGVKRICSSTVKGSGAITVNARKLYEIVREAPDERIRVEGDPQSFSVKIRSGKSRFSLMGLNPSDFPSVPGLSAKPGKGAVTMQAPAPALNRMIESTLFAVSMDETRFNLSGVYVEKHDDALRMVATDGHRLAVIDGEVEGKLPEKGVILPRKGLAEVKKLLESAGAEAGPVSFILDAPIAKIVVGQGELFMRLIDGEFPDYRQVMPKKGKLQVSLPREELLAALRRVSILSTERARGVRVTIKPGSLEVQTNNPDLGEATEDLEIGYTGEPLSIGFNSRYLIEALMVMQDTERVELSVTDDVSPGVLRCEGDERYSYVVMPMRL